MSLGDSQTEERCWHATTHAGHVEIPIGLAPEICWSIGNYFLGSQGLDCFISYSHVDEEIALNLQASLKRMDISAFMAPLSIRPGGDWNREIWDNLRKAEYVLFLASAEACNSPYVLQELGGAEYDKKHIIPIVWDMSPSELPGWTKRYQALDLRGQNVFAATDKVAALIQELRDNADSKELTVMLFAALAVFGVVYAMNGTSRVSAPQDPLACPNCSTGGKTFRMSPIPVEFRELEAATHECTKCKYKAELAAR